MRWLVMPAVGSCQSLPVLSSGFSGPVAISAPVGRGPLARNQSDDVRTIQDALNQVTLVSLRSSLRMRRVMIVLLPCW